MDDFIFFAFMCGRSTMALNVAYPIGVETVLYSSICYQGQLVIVTSPGGLPQAVNRMLAEHVKSHLLVFFVYNKCL